MAKYLLIAAVVISLVTAGLGYKNYTTLSDTKATLESTRGTLLTTTRTLETTKKELTATSGNLTTTTAEKEKLTAENAAAQSELSTAKQKLTEATTAVTAKETELASVNSDFEAYKQAHPADGTVAPSVNGGPDLTARVSELEALVTSLQDKLKGSESQLDVYKTKELAHQKGLLKNGLEGRVLAVNPAWNFVVLSIGDRQGVVNNAELLLKRGGQYLGKVRITSVEPSTSIADIVANTLPAGVAVQPGDSVIFQQSTEN